MTNFATKESAKSIFIANVKGGVGKVLKYNVTRALASNLPPQNITVIDGITKNNNRILSSRIPKLISSLFQLPLLLKYKYRTSPTIHKQKAQEWAHSSY